MDGSELQSLTLGLSTVDDYLQFVGARCRSNTWLATAYDLLVFFSVIHKYPAEITTTDVFAFLEAQRSPRRDGRVVRLEDRERGLAVAGRLSGRTSSLCGHRQGWPPTCGAHLSSLPCQPGCVSHGGAPVNSHRARLRRAQRCSTRCTIDAGRARRDRPGSSSASWT